MVGTVLSLFGLDEYKCRVIPFGNGLINHTWKISCGTGEFLLQKINPQVFRRPSDIMDNCSLLSDYFRTNHPGYLFVAPINTRQGQNYAMDGNDYFRLFPFMENSYTCDTVTDPSLAYEASKQFGKFTSLLSAFDPVQLHITLPGFHNLTLRYLQFETALQNGNKQRIARSGASIDFLNEQQGIVDVFKKLNHHSTFKIRVIHHDAKINNVLFDRSNNKGLCVIDLDTVMPGYYISDAGDMLRTYICPVSEEEQDFGRIGIREEYFREIVKGYMGEMQSNLSEKEKEFFVYAGKFAIFMQALRFLTDYLNNDIYYKIKYEDHNLLRANNQIVLLKRFLEKEERLNWILKSLI